MKISRDAKATAILRLDENLECAKVDKELSHLRGVLDYEIDYVNNSVRVEYDPLRISMDDIRKIVHH